MTGSLHVGLAALGAAIGAGLGVVVGAAWEAMRSELREGDGS